MPNAQARKTPNTKCRPRGNFKCLMLKCHQQGPHLAIAAMHGAGAASGEGRACRRARAARPRPSQLAAPAPCMAAMARCLTSAVARLRIPDIWVYLSNSPGELAGV